MLDSTYEILVWSTAMDDEHRRAGDRIRELMAARGVSQEAVAVELGVTQPQVSKRLAGVIAFRLTELTAIARLLNVPVARLLDEPVEAAS